MIMNSLKHFCRMSPNLLSMLLSVQHLRSPIPTPGAQRISETSRCQQEQQGQVKSQCHCSSPCV